MKRFLIFGLSLALLLVGNGIASAHGHSGAFATANSGYGNAAVFVEPTNAVFLPNYAPAAFSYDAPMAYGACPTSGSFAAAYGAGFAAPGYGSFASVRSFGGYGYGARAFAAPYAYRATVFAAPYVAAPTVVFAARGSAAVAGSAAAASSGSASAAASGGGRRGQSAAFSRTKRNGATVSKAISR